MSGRMGGAQSVHWSAVTQGDQGRLPADGIKPQVIIIIIISNDNRAVLYDPLDVRLSPRRSARRIN